MLGYLQLLDLEIAGPLSGEQRQHLGRATASARHLLELITEVLDFSRIEADRVTVGRATFRIGDAVQAAIELVTPQAQSKGIELREDVSGSASHLTAWGDESRVRQILVNLLGNAVKFTKRRDGEIARISVSAGTATQPPRDARVSGDGPWIFVRVEDTGPGIPPERLQPIFEPFVQANMALTRTHGGTGLGLAISRRLARLMGGDVTVSSQVGIGSSFFLWLPAEPVKSSLELLGQDGAVAGDREDTLIAGRPPYLNVRDVDDPTILTSTPAHGHARIAPPTRGEAEPLQAVGDVLLEQLRSVLQAIIDRLRSDERTPQAHNEDRARVEDHIGSFLVDLAGMFQHLEAIALSAAGEPTAEVRDVAAIQRVVAERHGAQRARLGWTENAIRREFEIIREEVRSSVRRNVPSRLTRESDEARNRSTERAIELLGQFLAATERLSLESFRHSVAPSANALDRDLL